MMKYESTIIFYRNSLIVKMMETKKQLNNRTFII